MELTCCYGILFVACAVLMYKLLDKLVRIPRLASSQFRYVLITGCDSGFGRGLAQRLDEKGFSVIAACLTKQGAEELEQASSERLKTLIMNVAVHDSVLKAFKVVQDEILIHGQGLWGLVNNAGITGKFGQVEWFSREDYLDVLSVNLLGMVDVTTTFLPLIKKEKGRIVNMSSMNGRFSFPTSLPYNVSKYGVEAFSDGLRRQLREIDVSVHIIEPGHHNTPLMNEDAIMNGVQQGWDGAKIPEKASKEHLFRAYKDKFANFIKSYKGQDPSFVVDAYEHALFARFPRARYVVGPEAILTLKVVANLPEWMSDFLVSCALGLPLVE